MPCKKVKRKQYKIIVFPFNVDPSLLNAKYHNGLVPIQLASNRGNRDLIRLLAEHGADLEVKNEEDKTPVVLACLVCQYFSPIVCINNTIVCALYISLIHYNLHVNHYT